MTRWALAALAVLTVGAAVRADDWTQFRGPGRLGVSAEKGLLAKWPDAGPALVWKFSNAGLGFASVAVQGSTLYTLGTRGDDEIVLALDAAKGTELWTAKIGPIFAFSGNVWGDGPRSTPTLDGDKLYALGGQGILVCLDAKTGAEAWRKNLVKDFGGEMMTEWGFSESPLVDGDRVVVTPGSKNGTLVALDKASGKTLWQSKAIDHKAPYSSMVVAEIQGVRQYVQLSYVDDNKGGFVNGVAAADGKLLWQENVFKGHSYAACPSPIVDGNLVYVTTGYGGGCHCFEIDKAFKAKDLFSKVNQKKMKNTHGGVVHLGGKIYGHSEGLGWACQDFKTGKVDWNERDKLSAKSGATIAAEGLLYLFSEEGEVGLARATPQGFEEISSFKLPQLSQFPQSRKTSSQSKAWSHPAIANGHLFLRDCEFVYCYDIRAKK